MNCWSFFYLCAILILGVILMPRKDRREEIVKEQQSNWEQLSIEEHMAHYEQQGINHKDAMKLVAKDRGVSKRDIYQYLVK